MACVYLLRFLQVFVNMCRISSCHTTLNITGEECGLRNEEFVIYKSQGA